MTSPINESNNNPSKVPDWINEANFQNVIEESIGSYQKILHFEAKETGGGGENYASLMIKVKVQVELKDGSTKDVSLMIKTTLPGEQGAALITQMGVFPKENAMYGKYLAEFQEMYRSVGKEVSFGPKFYRLKNDPGAEYVLLEDLSTKGFKNLKRQDGLNKEYTKQVLKMVAQLHAASAVRYEERGPYEESIMKSIYTEESRAFLDSIMGPIVKALQESYSKHDTGRKYIERMNPLFEKITDIFIEDGKFNPNDFNVVIHGDLWSNNIMFRQNDEGKYQQTMLVDFQMSRYASPVVDLYYFLLSSPSLDVKVDCFDEFIQFYHENLIENLELLKYPKKMPSLKQLRMDLLRYSTWGVSTTVGILAAVLLDPYENANIDNFFVENEQANDFRSKLYDNPRYVKHLDVILPWMEKNGYLDIS